MPQSKKWEEMTWQEKREARFDRWLNPPDVKFINQEAEQLYKARVTRFIKAIKLEEPDRVPCMLPTGNYPAYWGGASFHELMYNYKKGVDIWKKYMAAFGDMDTFNGPSLVPSGKISEVVRTKLQKLPGLGLPKDATMNQFVEGEYMMANEYDYYMMDPTDYTLRVMMPRTTPLFESFKKLPPFRTTMGNFWVAAMTDPDVRKTFETLMSLADEQKKWMAANLEINNYIKAHGYPSLFGGGPMAGAPFDHFADALRGTQGIARDMFRQPKKLHEAMEAYLKLAIETSIKNFPMTASPICMMPLHKGDDAFMSDKQFAEYYWPTYRRLLLAMIEEGLVPMPFAEGRYTKRLKQITDTPPSGVVWYFDQTDMKEAKRILGGICCIAGNVPTSVVIKGTPDTVKEYCRKLIQDCAPGGGFILAGGASIDNGKIENLKAMMEAAKEYGVYKK
ncbi:MAG: uroporphyrinogen decarboxylase family protein [Dehalococcoidales bacterium]